MRTVFLVYCLICLISDSYGELGFCNHEQPVIDICTHSELTMETTVYVDTVAVPVYQQTSCECSISPSISGVTFSFPYDDNSAPRNMVFKIDGRELKDAVSETVVSKLSVSTTSNFTTEGTCLKVSKGDNSIFNITCKANTETTTESGASSTFERSETATGHVPVTEQRTEEEEDKEENSLIRIVVPTVISALLILLVAVMIIIYLKRRRFEKGHKQQQSFAEPNAEQDHEQQSTPRNELGGADISINVYERLNVYANDDLAGEIYQQLEADETGKVQETHDANQDRKLTNTRLMVEQHDGPDIQRMRNNNSADNDLDIPPNEYERLNMYVNDNLAGEMYQQLHPDKSGNSREKTVPDSEVMPAVNSYTNVPIPSIFTGAVSKPDVYDDVA